MQGLMLAAPHSGTGKTLLTLVILRRLKQKGINIAPFKAGPDYIDPTLHRLACGLTSRNLDPWAMRPKLIHKLTEKATTDGKIVIVEAMMGLFDGALDGSGTPADLAQALKLPIVLIVDCRKISHSITALVSGFHHFRPDLAISGLILNKVGSARHEQMLRHALKGLNIPILGVVHRHDALVMPERHLGLVLPENLAQFENFMTQATALIEPNLDWDRLVQLFHHSEQQEHFSKEWIPVFRKKMRQNKKREQLAQSVKRFSDKSCAKNKEREHGSDLKITTDMQEKLRARSSTAHNIGFPPLGENIAIARDDVFCFSYPHIIESWQQAGSKISFFSPLKDEPPFEGADSLYLPGGYPELYAKKLASNNHFKAGMIKAAQANKVIYGECGGFMLLGDFLEDKQGHIHAMLGLLPLTSSFKKPRLHLGYRQLRNISNFPLPKQARGHEFHYSQVIKEGSAKPLFQISDALGQDLGTSGLVCGRVAGSFIHMIDII